MEAGELEYASWTEEQGKIPCVLYALCTKEYHQHELNFDQLKPTAATCTFTCGMNVPYNHRMEPGFH